MKLIKAYIRTYFVHDVILALERTGVPQVSAFNIAVLGEDRAQAQQNISSEFGLYTPMAKLELFVHDDKVEDAVNAILEHARSGSQGAKGDGIIAVSAVEEVICVRTGQRGEKITLSEC